MRLSILAASLALLLAAPAVAQTPATPPPVSIAAPADVASEEAIVAALYAVISGDAGVARDWNRFRSLFHPTGRLMPTGVNAEGVSGTRVLTPEDYINRAGPGLVRDGFHEREIARRIERFGHIAHVWTTYDSVRSLSDPAPFMRGINSIQLLHDGARWWVVSVYWQAETPEAPLPAEYLPPAN